MKTVLNYTLKKRNLQFQLNGSKGKRPILKHGELFLLFLKLFFDVPLIAKMVRQRYGCIFFQQVSVWIFFKKLGVCRNGQKQNFNVDLAYVRETSTARNFTAKMEVGDERTFFTSQMGKHDLLGLHDGIRLVGLWRPQGESC
ncbi:MAG: hypothetical protein ACK4Q5_10665 [Saprospiraceae bacterium]